MDNLLKLVALVLAELTRGAGLGRLGLRLAIAGACIVLAAIAVLVAAAWLVAALWLFAQSRWDPVTAALVCAGALVLLGVALLLVSALFWRRRASRPAAGLSELLGGIDAAKLVREHKGESLVGALVLGLILGSAGSRSKREKTETRPGA